MTKRFAASILWFLAVWGLGGVAALALDIPRWPMIVPAILVAAGVWSSLGRWAHQPLAQQPLEEPGWARPASLGVTTPEG